MATGCEYTYNGKVHTEADFKKHLMEGEFDKDMPESVRNLLSPVEKKEPTPEPEVKSLEKNTRVGGIVTIDGVRGKVSEISDGKALFTPEVEGRVDAEGNPVYNDGKAEWHHIPDFKRDLREGSVEGTQYESKDGKLMHDGKEVDNPEGKPVIDLAREHIEDNRKKELEENNVVNEGNPDDLKREADKINEKYDAQRDALNDRYKEAPAELKGAFASIAKENDTASAPKEYTISNINSIDKSRYGKVQKKVLDDVKRVIKSISKLVSKDTMKNLSVFVHDSVESFRDAIIKAGGSDADAYSGRGFYMAKDGTIHLNMNKVVSNTMLHEGVHPILDYVIKNNRELLDKFHNQLSRISGAEKFINDANNIYKLKLTSEAEQLLKDVADGKEAKIPPREIKRIAEENGVKITDRTTAKEAIAKLQERVSDFDNLAKEEAITEFVSQVADGKVKIDETNFDKIKRWVSGIFNKIGVPVVDMRDAKELKEFAKYIAGKFKEGSEINPDEISKNNSGVKEEGEGIKLQRWGGFEKKGFEETPDWEKLKNSGHVVEGFDVKAIAGKPVVIINPDNLITGGIVTSEGKEIVSGNGGINFVSKFGDVWVSSTKGTANTLARYINEAREVDLKMGGDGIVHIVVTKGDVTKSLSSHTGSKAAMGVVEHLVDKGLISASDFRNALNNVGKNKKYGIDFNGRNNAKEIHEDIKNKFFGVEDSSFASRGYFISDIIDYLGKNSESVHDNIDEIRKELNSAETGRAIKFGKAGVKDAIGLLLSDRMTVGVKGSHAYATIGISKPVKVEKGEHESYPWHIRQEDNSRPVLNVIGTTNHITDIVNDKDNNPVPRNIVNIKGASMDGAVTLGSNNVGLAKGFIKSNLELQGEDNAVPKFQKTNPAEVDERRTSVYVAPFFDATVSGIKDAKDVESSPAYRQHIKTLHAIADALGIGIESASLNVGRYTNSEGNKIREASTLVVLKTGDLDRAEQYAALSGALAPEVQESTIAARDLSESDLRTTVHDATRIVLKVSDLEVAMKYADDAGLDNTLGIDGKTIEFIEFNPEKHTWFDSKEYLNNFTNFVSKLKDNGIEYESRYHPIESRFITADGADGTFSRQSIIENAKREVGLQSGRQDLRDALSEAEKRNEEFIRQKQLAPDRSEYADLRNKQIELGQEGKELGDKEQKRLTELYDKLLPHTKDAFTNAKESYSQSKQEIDSVGKDAVGDNGFVVPSDIKSDDRAAIKTLRWYNGKSHWLGDGARTNIIVFDSRNIEPTFDKLKEQFHGGITREEPDSTELGYPKKLLEVRTSNGRIAEFQVMTPEGYLAKDGVSRFPESRKEFADNELSEIRQRLGWNIPDGVGHYLYEVSRDVNVSKDLRESARDISVKYYDAMLRPDGSKLSDSEFRKDISDFKESVDGADKSKWDEGNKAVAPKSLDEYLSSSAAKDDPSIRFQKESKEEEAARMATSRDYTLIKIEDLQEEVENEKGNLREEIARIKGEMDKVRSSSLSKDSKSERLDDLRYEIEDARDSHDSLVQSYKDDISQEKSDLRSYERRLAKLSAEGIKFQKGGDDKRKLDEYKKVIFGLVGKGWNNLKDVQDTFAHELRDNSKETRDFVKQAYDEFKKEQSTYSASTDNTGTAAAGFSSGVAPSGASASSGVIPPHTGARKSILNSEHFTTEAQAGISNLVRQHQQVWDEVNAEANAGTFVAPMYRDAILNRIEKGEKVALTDTMAMKFLYDRTQIQSEMERLSGALRKAHDNADGNAQAQITSLMGYYNSELERNREAIRLTGKEGGRGISALSAIVNLNDLQLMKWTDELRKMYGASDDSQIPKSAREFIRKLEEQYKVKLDELNGHIEKLKADYANKKFVKDKKDASTQRTKKDERADKLRDIANQLGSAGQSNIKLKFSFANDNSGEKLPDALRMIADGIGKRKIADLIDSAVNKFADSSTDKDKLTSDIKERLQDAGYSSKDVDRETTKILSVTEILEASKQANSETITKDGVRALRRLINDYVLDDKNTTLQAVVDAVMKDLSGNLPDLTEKEVMDAYSGYGLKPDGKAEISSRSKELKDQALKISQYQDLHNKLIEMQKIPDKDIPEQERIVRKMNSLLNGQIVNIASENGIPTSLLNSNQNMRSALDTMNQRLKEKIDDLQKKMDDLGKKGEEEDVKYVAPSVYGDARTVELEKDLRMLNKQFNARRSLVEAYNKDFVTKLLKAGVQMKRGFVLSHVTTLAKLTAALLENIAITPVRELSGGVFYGLNRAIDFGMMGHNTVYNDLILKADREGVPSFVAESAAWKALGGSVWRDFISEAKNGYSELGLLYGSEVMPDAPKEYKDFWYKFNKTMSYAGQGHAAIKSIPKRMEFERSYVLRKESAKRKGIDVEDPVIQTQLATAAYDDATASILMKDNLVSKAWSNMMQKGWNSDNGIAKFLAFAGGETMPIIKVPTNMVLEAGRYTLGGHGAALRIGMGVICEALNWGLEKVGADGAAKVVAKGGLQKLTPKEADRILSNLKKGSLAFALQILASSVPNAIQVSPFYHKGLKNEDGLEEGEMKIFGVTIPKILQDHPLFLSMRVHASAAELYNHYREKYSDESEATSAYYAVVGTAQGLAGETPFMSNTANLVNMLERPESRQATSFLGNFVKSTVEAGILIDIAKYQDSDNWSDVFIGKENKRATKSIPDYLQSGIPNFGFGIPIGSRDELPLK